MIYLIVLGVFSVSIGILAGQFARVGRGREPSIGRVWRILVFLIAVGCLVFFASSAMACEDVDDRTEVKLITDYVPCHEGWCRRNRK